MCVCVCVCAFVCSVSSPLWGRSSVFPRRIEWVPSSPSPLPSLCESPDHHTHTHTLMRTLSQCYHTHSVLHPAASATVCCVEPEYTVCSQYILTFNTSLWSRAFCIALWDGLLCAVCAGCILQFDECHKSSGWLQKTWSKQYRYDKSVLSCPTMQCTQLDLELLLWDMWDYKFIKW